MYKTNMYLLGFLKAYHEWALANAGKSLPNHPVFHNSGLCSNYDYWLSDKEQVLAAGLEWHDEVNYDNYGALCDAFDERDLCCSYPFGESDYDDALVAGTMHQCPVRLHFVAEVIKEIEEELPDVK